MRLPKISGKTVQKQVEWLKKENCGCYHFRLVDTEKYRMHICIGWTQYVEDYKWRIAWKIGMETFDNAMQCDFDIDFLMPFDEKTDEVYDTLEGIGEIKDMKGWNALAVEMNKTAEKVVKWQIENEKRISKS